jgi:hypothetical protein
MKAKLTIQFDDGSTEEIFLESAIEIKTGPAALQAIEFRQTKSGKWIMAFTQALWKGRKFADIKVNKI